MPKVSSIFSGGAGVDNSTLQNVGNVLSVKPNGITASQIAPTTITAAQIAAATLTATQMANATVTGAKIAGSTITGSNIAASTIAAGNLNFSPGTVTGVTVSPGFGLSGGGTISTSGTITLNHNSAAGTIGTYCFGFVFATNLGFGAVVSASSINIGQYPNFGGNPPGGAWQCMGFNFFSAVCCGPTIQHSTVWLRLT